MRPIILLYQREPHDERSVCSYSTVTECLAALVQIFEKSLVDDNPNNAIILYTLSQLNTFMDCFKEIKMMVCQMYTTTYTCFNCDEIKRWLASHLEKRICDGYIMVCYSNREERHKRFEVVLPCEGVELARDGVMGMPSVSDLQSDPPSPIPKVQPHEKEKSQVSIKQPVQPLQHGEDSTQPSSTPEDGPQALMKNFKISAIKLLEKVQNFNSIPESRTFSCLNTWLTRMQRLIPGIVSENATIKKDQAALTQCLQKGVQALFEKAKANRELLDQALDITESE